MSIVAQLATIPTVVTVTKTTHWQLMDSPVSNVLHLLTQHGKKHYAMPAMMIQFAVELLSVTSGY